MQYQFASKTQTVRPAVPSSDTLDASVTVYPSYVQLAARMLPNRRFCAAQFSFFL